MGTVTPGQRLGGTAVAFAIALVFFVIASLSHVVWPLFVGWIPLLAVPWLLTRPLTGESPRLARPDTEDTPDAGSPERPAGPEDRPAPRSTD